MQQVAAFFSIFVKKARTMDDYEKRFQPDPEEVKKEKRTRILSNIATFLIVTSIMAGGYCITNWYKPTATDFDVPFHLRLGGLFHRLRHPDPPILRRGSFRDALEMVDVRQPSILGGTLSVCRSQRQASGRYPLAIPSLFRRLPSCRCSSASTSPLTIFSASASPFSTKWYG